jgi:antitoxin FitA
MQYDARMGRTLQIRNVPDDVYEALAYRAEREGRSLAQQALHDLRQTNDQQREDRRRQILDEILADYRAGRTRKLGDLPERWIREDRDR